MNVFHKGFVFPLKRANVDTDQIIPKQFLKRVERTGFGQFLFYDWRFDHQGQKRDDFPLNQPKYRDVTILVSRENFGCGSSREHAPWALEDYGFKVIISPSFADIFYNNAVKNGIVPIKLTEQEVEKLLKSAEESGYELIVDLENGQLLGSDGFMAHFTLPPYQKEMLLNGWDEIAITLQLENKINEYEEKVSLMTHVQ